jgi:hypothetical protein
MKKIRYLDPEQIAKKLLKLPPAEWSQAMNYPWTPERQGDWDCVGDVLDSQATRRVLLSGYIFARVNGQNHSQSVRAANRKLVKIRRAIGYSYPKAGMIVF